MLADGRLNLSAVVMLAGYLTPQTAEELLAAAANRTNAGIEQLLAERFPRPDLPELIAPVESSSNDLQLSVRTVECSPAGQPIPPSASSLPVPGTVASRVAPLAPERYAIQCTVGPSTYKKLEYAKALLGHSVPSGQLDQVLGRALDALIAHLERRKFAKTDRPRPRQRTRRTSANARHIPADVKRAIWQRDGGQCTFVSASGHRCEARTRLSKSACAMR
jgi:hypothetical protein